MHEATDAGDRHAPGLASRVRLRWGGDDEAVGVEAFARLEVGEGVGLLLALADGLNAHHDPAGDEGRRGEAKEPHAAGAAAGYRQRHAAGTGRPDGATGNAEPAAGRGRLRGEEGGDEPPRRRGGGGEVGDHVDREHRAQ